MEWKEYLPMAMKIAHKIKNHVHDFDDCLQLAYLGYYEAKRRFDPNRGVKFTTYAGIRISGYIRDEFRKLDIVSRNHRKIRSPKQISLHDDLLTSHEVKRGIWEYLKGFNSIERFILIHYYEEGKTMEVIGQELNLSESRISQIHADILHRLRQRHAA